MDAQPSVSSTPLSVPPKRKRLAYRLVRLVIIGGLAAAAALGWVYFFTCLPLGEGPAGPAVPRAAFAKTWTTRKVLLLGLGDSVTAGYGVPASYSYFGRLAKTPDDEFEDLRGVCLLSVLPNLRIKNLAVSDSTSPMHLETIRQALEKQDADVFGLVVITSGGNDLMHSRGRRPPCEAAMYGATGEQARPWIENYEKRLDAMIGLLEGRFPGGCLIFLADIYDPSDGASDPAAAGLPAWPDCMPIHQAYNEALRRAAARHATVHVVPMHEAFLGHGIHCTQPWRPHYRRADPTYWYAVNLEDPNLRGYDAIRRLFLIEIAKCAATIAAKR